MLMPTAGVMAEVVKCDVVCANCHRVRTRDAELKRVRRAPSAAPMQVLKRARWKHQAKLLKQLREGPCSDCGRRYDAAAMDFDHRNPSTKVSVVTRMVGRASTDAILAEATKCDIVCANCHRVRTFERRTHGERE